VLVVGDPLVAFSFFFLALKHCQPLSEHRRPE
jgi:hypothetical protein